MAYVIYSCAVRLYKLCEQGCVRNVTKAERVKLDVVICNDKNPKSTRKQNNKLHNQDTQIRDLFV